MSLFDVCKIERERQIMMDVDIGDEVRLLLLRLGVLPRLIGYDYLTCAIKLTVADKEYVRHITTQMYPVIADRFGVDPSVVERNIRHALETALLRGRIGYLNEYLGTEVFSENDRPTNAEFISVVADKVANELFRRSAFSARESYAR